MKTVPIGTFLILLLTWLIAFDCMLNARHDCDYYRALYLHDEQLLHEKATPKPVTAKSMLPLPTDLTKAKVEKALAWRGDGRE